MRFFIIFGAAFLVVMLVLPAHHRILRRQRKSKTVTQPMPFLRQKKIAVMALLQRVSQMLETALLQPRSRTMILQGSTVKILKR